MRVLFAVNDENISTSIVKKYQKQYKEIISYKNVYYFEAILKELQRNKNYDRIVIGEDLEEFASASLEQQDKFIFDRLDSISDEAVTTNGSDIPVILICSERRTKSEDILVKLFGIGIYNAIIGKDRTTEEVCRLINKPRSKKEAKIYYQIDSENVTYEKESESDVSEVEMQNILMHFKKLGDNEEKYAESFKNIVSQYTPEQLKVIIAVLPNNVKNVLTETSPEYQKIVYPSGISKSVNKVESKKNSKTKIKKGTSEKLLDIEDKPVMTKPVVVPTTMKGNMYINVNKPKKKIDLDEIEDDDDLTNIDDIIEEKPKKRGRPKKSAVVEEVPEENKPKKRGRPKKKVEEEILPGLDEIDEESEDEIVESKKSKVNTAKAKEEEINILPGFDDDDDDDDEDDYNNTTYEEDDDDVEDDYKSEPITNNNRTAINEPYRTRLSREEKRDTYNQELKEYDNVFDDGKFESLLTGDKKVAAFVGTSKNGTSFIVNNVAQILSGMGINTAILDATKNKNAYYIYTKNDEDLRNIAVNAVENLIAGQASGIKVNNNLTVYTSIPSQDDEIKNSHPIMESLVKNHSLILIDCDFDTPAEYFDKAQELYLIQSMDVLTIQPLTEFLRELKTKGILEESKIRIILNKMLKVRGVTGKNIIGGMSNYNDPEMSFMNELFDRNTVKVSVQIPFDEDVYARYLESLIECEIKLNGYPKEIKSRLTTLAGEIYPLLPNNNNNKKGKKNTRNSGYSGQYSGSFSSGMNNTLNNMRNRY